MLFFFHEDHIWSSIKERDSLSWGEASSPLTALSIGSSVWRIFFWMSSSGPGRWLSWSFSWSANLAFFSIRCLSARLGSTWPTSSRICCLTSSSLPGLCWIFAFRRSPVFARSSCFLCSWNAGGVFNAKEKKKKKIRKYSLLFFDKRNLQNFIWKSFKKFKLTDLCKFSRSKIQI